MCFLNGLITFDKYSFSLSVRIGFCGSCSLTISSKPFNNSYWDEDVHLPIEYKENFREEE